jgi:hypothetical protein
VQAYHTPRATCVRRAGRRYLGGMARSWTLLASAVSSVAFFCAGAPALAATRAAHGAVAPASLRRSQLLWATIDVCNPADQPDMVGIRGSMPGDRRAHDSIYMRFRLQYQSASTKRWIDVGVGASSRFIKVGSARSARQDGLTFQLMPASGKPAVTLRGVVTFQWRRGSLVLASISRATSAGHESLAGADPPNFSAATCTIG